MNTYSIICAMRGVAQFVPLFHEMIRRFTVRPSSLFLAVNDDEETWAQVAKFDWGPGKVWAFRTSWPLYPREASRRRSIHLAQVRNRVIEEALIHGHWPPVDVYLMADCQKYASPDLPAKLMEVMSRRPNAGIVAPMGLRTETYFADSWCYFDLDGPIGHDVGAIQKKGSRPMQSVGGTYLVDRNVFVHGARLGGTDGGSCDSYPLCKRAREMGYEVWMDTTLATYSCMMPEEFKRRMG